MRVLISGAGIAGPTLAWFLAKSGAQVDIVEKSHALLSHGQNVDFKGSAVTVMKKMGLMDQIRRLNTTEKGTQLIDSKGRPFALFPINEGRSASLTSEFEILRGDLAAILYEATKANPNINYRFGTTIKEVLSNNKDDVKVELSNGKIEEFDLLVAADGQWSKLRQQCSPPHSINIVNLDMYTAYWTVPRLPIDNDWWNIYLALSSRSISLRPDPHGTIRTMVTLMPRTSTQRKAWQDASKSSRQTQEALLRSEFANAVWQAPRLLAALDQAPDFYFHPMQQIKMSQWSNSRVVCLGDAAHAPSPVAGGGTSLAILGAYVLAGELSKLGEGEDPSRALEAYESAFRPYIEEAQKIPFFAPGIAHPETAWKRWLIHALIWVISKIVSLPWMASKSNPSNEEDFALPRYSRFDDEVGR